MPNTIFSCQKTSKKAKFLEFGLKNANLSTWPYLATTGTDSCGQTWRAQLAD